VILQNREADVYVLVLAKGIFVNNTDIASILKNTWSYPRLDDQLSAREAHV
jgi:hypothetical protein